MKLSQGNSKPRTIFHDYSVKFVTIKIEGLLRMV